MLRRYRTLAARRVRSDALDEATLRAAARIAERAVEDGRPSDGADKALTKAFRALAEGDLSGARPSPAVRRAVIEQFHRLYYHSRKQTWKNTRFYGVTVWKNPMDLWLYQEMIHEFRPDVVIEAGTKYGGSAYYFARLFDLVGHGQVITIDTTPQPDRPEHPRITYLTGSSTDPVIAESVHELVVQRQAADRARLVAHARARPRGAAALEPARAARPAHCRRGQPLPAATR